MSILDAELRRDFGEGTTLMPTHPFYGAIRSGQGTTEYHAQVPVEKSSIDGLWGASVTIHVARKDGSRVSDDDHFMVGRDFDTDQAALNAGAAAAAAWGLRR